MWPPHRIHSITTVVTLRMIMIITSYHFSEWWRWLVTGIARSLPSSGPKTFLETETDRAR
jgi:hypothetical protein